jgi:hypothetical protein
MSTDKNELAKTIQSLLETRPTVILGSGASVPYGLPTMNEISDALISVSKDNSQEDFQLLIRKLSNGENLEQAVDESNLSDETLKTVKTSIGNLINCKDSDFFKKIKSENPSFAMKHLFEKIIEPAGNKVDVITTNDDRIPEYAADLINATSVTCFEGQFIKTFELENSKTRNQRIRAREKVVRIHKVNGSLDWFSSKENEKLGFPFMSSIPDGHVPLIIPPNQGKYKETHDEPYTAASGDYEPDDYVKRGLDESLEFQKQVERYKKEKERRKNVKKSNCKFLLFNILRAYSLYI